MINFFSNYKIIFYFLNFSLIFLYLFPGSLLGMILYDNKSIQPQITPDFFISSNHFYVFCLISIIGFMSYLEAKKNKYLIWYLIFLSIIGFLTFLKQRQKKNLIIYLFLLSIILEYLHLFLPERSFQWSDLFGNLLGVLMVILIKNIINKYVPNKK